MPKTVNRSERRVQIMEGLHQCLLEKPFHQTSIKEIARKAGVNHGLLHYYFENKQDLLLNYIDHTFDHYYGRFLKRFPPRTADGASATFPLEEGMRWLLDEVAFNRESARIFTEIWALAMHDGIVRQKLHALYARWQSHITAATGGPGENPEKASRLGLTLIALIEGLSLFSALYSRDALCGDVSFTELLNALEPANT